MVMRFAPQYLIIVYLHNIPSSTVAYAGVHRTGICGEVVQGLEGVSPRASFKSGGDCPRPSRAEPRSAKGRRAKGR